MSDSDSEFHFHHCKERSEHTQLSLQKVYSKNLDDSGFSEVHVKAHFVFLRTQYKCQKCVHYEAELSGCENYGVKESRFITGSG